MTDQKIVQPLACQIGIDSDQGRLRQRFFRRDRRGWRCGRRAQRGNSGWRRGFTRAPFLNVSCAYNVFH